MKSVVRSRTWRVLDLERKLERGRNKRKLALHGPMRAPARPVPPVGRPAHNEAGLFDHRLGNTNRRREPSHEQARPPSQNAIEKKPSKSNSGRKRLVVCSARPRNRCDLRPRREMIPTWKDCNGGPRNPCSKQGFLRRLLVSGRVGIRLSLRSGLHRIPRAVAC